MKRRLNIDIRTQVSRIAERNENYLRYTNEVRNLKTYKQEDEAKIIDQYKKSTGREKAKLQNEIALHHQLFILAMAKRFGNGDNILDLVNEGNIGLIKALDRFDPSFNNGFLTFAAYYIRREMDVYRCIKNRKIKFPDSTTAQGRIKNVRTNLASKLEREPLNEEVEDELERLYGNRYSRLVKANLNFHRIDYDPNDESEERSTSGSLEYNKQTASYNLYEATMERENDSSKVNQCLGKLSKREKDIIVKLYGLNGEKEHTIEETAQMMGLTKERVRQIKLVSLKKMKYSANQ